MIAPFNPDGSVNPQGVRDCHPEPVDPKTLLEDFSDDKYKDKKGWNCMKCNVWIDCAPRPSIGPEPPTWWWCNSCKKGASASTLGRSKAAPVSRKRKTDGVDLRGIKVLSTFGFKSIN
jgi:hypothetical protein